MNSENPVLPIFIFDTDIVDELPINDSRISFIYQNLKNIDEDIKGLDSSLRIFKCSPIDAFNQLLSEYTIENVFFNEDYEPYALERDNKISLLLEENNIKLKTFTDQVVFKPGTILKEDGLPYTVFTPFKNKWLKHFELHHPSLLPPPNFENLIKINYDFPSMEALGFSSSKINVEKFNFTDLNSYALTRDIPSMNGTSYLGPHLRFGTISVREVINQLKQSDSIFLSELIWREFFIQIMYHFPRVVNENFKIKYNGIQWRNKESEFELWCQGKTGYAIVDAGMRQLNETGYMHNRVRMITASFLCKHLLIDWRWGEAYFAKKLLDFELSSNNGNWQWVSGTGCDSAPYFRVFSPSAQTLKFDKDLKYIKKWVPEYNSLTYVPMIDHKIARERALVTYKKGLENILT
jgi:deoxyribodipyrimidine photo-lyase